MKKLCIAIALVIALSCFAIAAFATDIPSLTASASASAAIAGLSDPGSAIAGAVVVILGLSAASAVVLRRK